MDAGEVIEREPWWHGEAVQRVIGVLNGVRIAVWLALLGFVIVPASLCATFLAAEVIFDATTPKEMVQSFYTDGDLLFRAAPAGMVRVPMCDDPDAAPLLRNEYGDKFGCKHQRMINVPTSQVIADKMTEVTFLYWMLVCLSALGMLAYYTPRFGAEVWDFVTTPYWFVESRIRRRMRYAKWVRDGSDGIPPL